MYIVQTQGSGFQINQCLLVAGRYVLYGCKEEKWLAGTLS